MNKPTIFHIRTGGTIGGCVPEYKEIEQLTGVFTDFVNFKKYIEDSYKVFADYQELELCHKDSREINNADREQMLQIISRQFSQGVTKFMITHGTYTMPDTAKYLEEHLESTVLENCRIVLTGSMFPWTILGSDAPMNLGSALSSLINREQSGVFLNMHGKDFFAKNVQKDINNLIFVEE